MLDVTNMSKKYWSLQILPPPESNESPQGVVGMHVALDGAVLCGYPMLLLVFGLTW